MLFIYYDHKNNTEKTVEIDIDDIMIIHPILGGDTTSVMLKKGDVEYAYVMFNKFDTIPLNNNCLIQQYYISNLHSINQKSKQFQAQPFYFY